MDGAQEVSAVAKPRPHVPVTDTTFYDEPAAAAAGCEDLIGSVVPVKKQLENLQGGNHDLVGSAADRSTRDRSND